MLIAFKVALIIKEKCTHADVHIKPYIGVSYRRTFHKRGRTVGLSLERLGEA